MGLDQGIALLEDAWRELRYGVVMRLAREVAIAQSVNILKVRLIFPPIETSAFMI